MQNIFKIIVFFLILVLITWILLEKEYLKLSTFLGPNSSEIVKENNSQETPKLDTIHQDVMQDKNSIEYKGALVNKSQAPALIIEEEALINCKNVFLAIDNILIKFFQRQNFSDEILLLQNKDIPQNLHEQLDNIMELYNYKEHNIIQNKIISKVIRIEKISEDSMRKKNFIDAMKLLQEYFYSKKFLANCKL